MPIASLFLPLVKRSCVRTFVQRKLSFIYSIIYYWLHQKKQNKKYKLFVVFIPLFLIIIFNFVWHFWMIVFRWHCDTNNCSIFIVNIVLHTKKEIITKKKHLYELWTHTETKTNTTKITRRNKNTAEKKENKPNSNQNKWLDKYTHKKNRINTPIHFKSIYVYRIIIC